LNASSDLDWYIGNITNRYDSYTIFEHFEIVKQSKDDHLLLIDDLTFIEFTKLYNFTGIKLLRNKFSPTTIPFAVVPCYFLSKSIKLKLKQMEVAGLIDFYMRKFANRKYLELIEDDEGPNVFTLDQLAIGFQAFLLFLGVAAIIFVLEILLFCLSKLIGKVAIIVAVCRALTFQY